MSEIDKRTVSFTEFQRAVQGLRGKQAWRSRTGSGTGSIFTMDFRAVSELDKHQSKFNLMVYCSWRIVQAEKILCTWYEDADNRLAPALKALEGISIANAALTEWGDLTINFLNGCSLHIWNDVPFKDDDSWFIGCSGSGYYSVATRNAFFYEPRVD